MTLPRELRDKIYGYLLRVDRHAIMEHNKTNPAKFDLSILRVNKTLHNEASKSFLEDNPWVCVEIEASLLEKLLGKEIGYRKGFHGSNQVSVASYVRAAAAAIATISLRVIPPLGPASDQFFPASDQMFLIVSLFAIPRLCRILTAHDEIDKIDFIVLLNVASARKVMGAWQERLLDSFQEARGIGRASIFDPQRQLTHVELTTMMMSPITKFQDIFDRVFTYHDGALQKKQLGQFSEACYDYQDCQEFILWFSTNRYGHWLRSCNDDGVDSVIMFQVLPLISASCALVCIKLGDFDRALSVVGPVSGEGRHSLKYEFETEVWYHRGLRDLATGAGNGAAYCFLQTLWRGPGHSGADEAIDKMESRLQTDTGMTEGTILHNIQNVLLHFRHKKSGSDIMSKVDYNTHAEKWHLVGKDRCVSYPPCVYCPPGCKVEGNLDRILTFCSVILN